MRCETRSGIASIMSSTLLVNTVFAWYCLSLTTIRCVFARRWHLRRSKSDSFIFQSTITEESTTSCDGRELAPPTTVVSSTPTRKLSPVTRFVLLATILLQSLPCSSLRSRRLAGLYQNRHDSYQPVQQEEVLQRPYDRRLGDWWVPLPVSVDLRARDKLASKYSVTHNLSRPSGNELGAWMGQEGYVVSLEFTSTANEPTDFDLYDCSYPPLAWTNNIAKYIKGLAPRQLVIDGSDGFRR